MKSRTWLVSAWLALIAVFACAVFSPSLNLLAAPASPAAKSGAKAVGLPPSTVPIGDKWAVVIGIGEFADGSVPPLKYAAKDAKDFYDYLVDPRGGNFQKDHVKLLINEDATFVNIRDTLGDSFLPHAAQPEDLVVIYLSTHGSPAGADMWGVNYVLAYDTQVNKLFATGLQMREMMQLIEQRLKTKRVMVVLDTCYSGAGAQAAHKGLVRTNVDAPSLAKEVGGVVISSSGPDQRSWESDDLKNSYFTRYFIESLKSGPEHMTVEQAFNSMKNKVQSLVLRDKGELQTPVISGSFSGPKLVLGVAPTVVREPPLTVPLRGDDRLIASDTKAAAGNFALYGKRMQTARQLINERKFYEAARILNEAVAMNPSSVEVYLVSSDVYDAQKNFNEALKSASRAVLNGERSSQAWVSLARGYLRQGQYHYALQQVEKALTLDPHNSMARYWLGYINEKHFRRVDLAEQHYRKALELNGLNVPALVALGSLIESQNRDIQQAEDYFKRAIQADADNWEARWRLARLLVAHSVDLEQAQQHVRTAIKVEPDNALLHCELGNILTLMGKAHYEEAETEYRKALDLDANSGYIHFAFARFLDQARHRKDQAELEYREAVRLDPSLVEARVYFGNLLVSKRAFDKADEQYRKALELDGRNAAAYVGLAMIQAQLFKNYNAAVEKLRKALTIRPDYSEAQDMLGLILHRHLGRRDEAMKAFEEAIKSDPNNAKPHYHLAMLMLEDAKKRVPDAVLEHLQKAAQLDPKTSHYRTRMGQVLSQYYKKHRDAEAEYRKAIEVNLTDSEAHYRLGLLLIEKFNQRKAGEKELRTAYEQDSNDPDIKAAFQRFVH